MFIYRKNSDRNQDNKDLLVRVYIIISLLLNKNII